MTFKAGILAAAAALTLTGVALAAPAMAQPGRDPSYAGAYYDIPRQAQTTPQRGYAADPGYAPPAQYRDAYRPNPYRDDRYAVGYRDERDYRDWRREQAQREWWRMEHLRRLQWERDHSYRGW
jgi:hypothetical protein